LVMSQDAFHRLDLRFEGVELLSPGLAERVFGAIAGKDAADHPTEAGCSIANSVSLADDALELPERGFRLRPRARGFRLRSARSVTLRCDAGSRRGSLGGVLLRVRCRFGFVREECCLI